MTDDYKIAIRSRGEEVVYVDADGEFHFEVTHEPPFAVLHASTYWNGQLPHSSGVLTPRQRDVIIPRIVEYFTQRGSSIRVADSNSRDQAPHHSR